MGSQLGVADALGFATIGAIGGAMVALPTEGVLELGPALALVFLLALGHRPARRRPGPPRPGRDHLRGRWRAVPPCRDHYRAYACWTCRS